MFKKLQLWIMASVLAFSGVSLAKEDTPDTIAGTTKVTAEDVLSLFDDQPDLVIIDARKAADRKGNGWIPGSIGLPNTDTTPERLAEVLPSKSTPVLIYCNGVKCGRSVESSKMAVKAGYQHIYWFRGGWDEWMKAGYPVER